MDWSKCIFHLLHVIIIYYNLFNYILDTLYVVMYYQCSPCKFSKRPQHLGVVFCPLSQQDIKLVVQFISWANDLGIEKLSLYDTNGILQENSSHLISSKSKINLLSGEQGKVELCEILRKWPSNVVVSTHNWNSITDHLEESRKKTWGDDMIYTDCVMIVSDVHSLQGFPFWYLKSSEIQ